LSFRQTEPELRDRYFRQSADGWQLHARVLGCVHFTVGNVFDPPAIETYDLILCRNLLIYLTAAARRRALDALETMLAPGGLLAVGHAEPQALAGRRFRAVGPESHFVYCREPSLAHSPAPVRRPVRTRAATNAAPAPTPLPPVPPTPLVASEEPLARARRLADGGRLDEALEACRSHLKLAAPTAHAYSLLGAIHQARGDAAAAADAFRKSLYLDPDDHDALTHALLLAARTGDTARAAALRERLDRTDSRGEA
jgi:chemotaxis protein methyltransferase WspC